MRVFVDTNLWLYRLDRRDPDKQQRIRIWLQRLAQDHEIVVSTQVLIELRAVLSNKFKPAFTPAQISQALDALVNFEVITTDQALIQDAHQLAVNEQLSWFDALIVEAAIRSHCRILFSEDMAHNRRLGGLIIRNPFLDPAD